MSDDYQRALGHLRHAQAAMVAQQDTLAVATIAHALSVVEAAAGTARALSRAAAPWHGPMP